MDEATDLPSAFTHCTLVDGHVAVRTRELAPLLLLESAVVIRVLKMGVCRADVKEVVGARDIPADRGPLFGHELVGQIVASTADGFDAPVGSLVTFNPNITPERSAGFAEFMYVQGSAETLARCVVPLHDQTGAGTPWMPEPFACIVHAVDSSPLSEVAPGEKVAVIGAGGSGALFSLYCSYLGAEVHIFNRRPERLDFLETRGLAHQSRLHPLSAVDGYADSFDHVIIATTQVVRPVMDDADRLCAAGGTILLYGGTQSDSRWLDSEIDIDSIRRCETRQYVAAKGKQYWLTGAYGCSASDFNRAMHLVDDYSEQFPVSALTSREVRLAEFPDLINEMAAGTDYPGKILVSP